MISVVLVHPETPGNVGAIARVMKNFGFSKLLLIGPVCDHLCDEAFCRAKHAKDVLKKAKKISWDDVKGFDLVVGTTAKMGTIYNVPRAPLTPKELASRRLPAKTALVFGPEGEGLSNQQVRECDLIVAVPTKKKYRALNISHAVSIMLYELSNRRDTIVDRQFASAKEKELILKRMDEVLAGMHFPTPHARETQSKVWKRIIGKSFLTKREAFALLGFLKKLK
ncbi:MAG: RNA methyltransferase [Nanoarchaeota archaeon]|nr:RNA methyltransferase [Nanoarchaeota archaeon]